MCCSFASFGCGGGEDAVDTSPQDVPVATVDATNQQASAPSVEPARLELRVRKGQRFPLLKTVRQTLRQSTAEGETVGESELTLLMGITVVDVAADGRKLLQVDYDKVQYSQDVADRRFSYDSTNPPNVIPDEALAYHGLAHNGFQFWLGADNRILEPVAFNEFLERCVRAVPVHRRKEALDTLTRSSGEGNEGIANFVDDSIGLLPLATKEDPNASLVWEGKTWRRDRRFLQPVPVYVDSVCTVTTLNDYVAEIEIVGRVAPSNDFAAPGVRVGGVAMRVVGGQSLGSCVIRRDTGLPQSARIERTVDMEVRLAGGSIFPQRKTIITTIQSFPQQSSPVNLPERITRNPGRSRKPNVDPRVQPASGVR